MKLTEAYKILSDEGIEDAKWEARMLFSEIGGIPTASLIGCDAECDSPALKDAIRKRAKREPLQYILGYADFYRNPRRSDTEAGYGDPR